MVTLQELRSPNMLQHDNAQSVCVQSKVHDMNPNGLHRALTSTPEHKHLTVTQVP